MGKFPDWQLDLIYRLRQEEGNTGNVPPPKKKLKKLLEKNDVISEGSIFNNNLSKSR